MRLRKSASCASGAWKEKGRMSSLAAILESPCLESWLERASPAATQCGGRRLTALAPAEAARTLRRVGDDESLDMVTLQFRGAGTRVDGIPSTSLDTKDDRSGARDESYVRLPGSHLGMNKQWSAIR